MNESGCLLPHSHFDIFSSLGEVSPHLCLKTGWKWLMGKSKHYLLKNLINTKHKQVWSNILERLAYLRGFSTVFFLYCPLKCKKIIIIMNYRRSHPHALSTIKSHHMDVKFIFLFKRNTENYRLSPSSWFQPHPANAGELKNKLDIWTFKGQPLACVIEGMRQH